jgi:hypothetical protein
VPVSYKLHVIVIYRSRKSENMVCLLSGVNCEEKKKKKQRKEKINRKQLKVEIKFEFLL